MKPRMKFTLLWLWPAIWVLSSCTITPTPSPTSTIQPPPTARPTSILNPATEYSLGICDVPEGYYLFLKYASYLACSSACDCPVVEPPDSAIDRHEGNIYYMSGRVIGSFKPWDPEDTAQGFIIYGSFEEQIYVFEDVPFEIPGSRKPVVGCDSTGIAIIELGGQAFELEPGGEWSSQSVHDRGDSCYETYTISMANYGLIENSRFISDLSARDERIQLEIMTRYFSLDEEISFDILVSGEDNIDFSHFCPITFEMKEADAWSEVGSCSNIPDYVPEPYPRMPGELIEIEMPLSTIGLKYDYQYELDVGEFRIKFTYAVRNEWYELYSNPIRITP